MKRLTIGLDLGTTHVKAVALDSGGRVVASDGAAVTLEVPNERWAEQSVHQVWEAACAALKGAIAGIDVGRLDCLCLSGAMHSLLPVDGDGKVLAPAMTWADNRAADLVERLRPEAAGLYVRTGCPWHSSYQAPRLRWWQSQQPQVARYAARFAAIKDWVLHELTGRWVTDVALASSTGLLDIRTRQWDDHALQLAGIDASRLCPLAPMEQVIGGLTAHAAEAVGLPVGLPVVIGGSDGALANLAAGGDGSPVITVGTSGAVRVIATAPYLDPRQRTWCYALDERRWLVGGAINNGGLALQWVADRFYADVPPQRRFAQLHSEAADIAPGCDGVVMRPYFTGERSPHWSPNLRASVTGMSLSHSRAHLARAAMEAVAFCLAQVWQTLTPVLPADTRPRLTGGITHNRVWSQILCDVLGVPLQIADLADASALGAAMLGHAAMGSTKAAPLHDAGVAMTPDAARHNAYRQGLERFRDGASG